MATVPYLEVANVSYLDQSVSLNQSAIIESAADQNWDADYWNAQAPSRRETRLSSNVVVTSHRDQFSARQVLSSRYDLQSQNEEYLLTQRSQVGLTTRRSYCNVLPTTTHEDEHQVPPIDPPACIVGPRVHQYAFLPKQPQARVE